VKSLGELLAAAGLKSPQELKPHHILRRIGDGRILSLGNQFTFLQSGELLQKKPPAAFAEAWAMARPDRFVV
jgi:hypothetical protein